MTSAAPKPAPPKGKRVNPEGVTTTYEEITPEIAAKWLELNHSNRTLQEARVTAMVDDILHDRWKLTHQGIGFDTNGDLFDGQHRLTAVLRSGKTVKMMVTRGMDPDTKEVTDIGKVRSFTDILNFRGFSNRAILGAVVKMHLHYLKGTSIQSYGKAISVPELIEHLEEYEQKYSNAAKLAGAWYVDIDAPPKVVGTAYCIFEDVDPAAALEFFESMVNHATNGEDDPRRALMSRLRSMKVSGEKIPTPLLLNLFVKAWNQWRTGTPATRMQVDRLKTKKVLEAI